MPRNQQLPGMENRNLTEIEEAAEAYRQVRDERCALSRREAEAKSALIEVMKKAGRSHYAFNGLVVSTSVIENVKVKSKDDDEDGDESTYMTASGRAPRKSKDEPAAATIASSNETKRADSETAATEFFGKKAKKQASDAKREAGAADDDFTAEKCHECGRIDGGHARECGLGGKIPYSVILEYCKAQQMRSPASQARKLELSGEKNAEIRAWLAGRNEAMAEEVQEKAAPSPQGGRKRGRTNPVSDRAGDSGA